MALNRNTRSSRREQQGRKLPQIKKSEKKKCKTLVTRNKQYQPSVKIVTTVTKAAKQLNKVNSLKSNELKQKYLSVKTSKRLTAKAGPDKLSIFTPVTLGAAIEVLKTPRKSSKMHNDQFERRRRSASQCCADCKLVVHKREQLRLRASLGIKLCDPCWEKRNTKTPPPNRSQKSHITKSCEIKLIDILRTTDSSLNLNADKQTTRVKRKKEQNALSGKGSKKLKLQNSVSLEESEADTDVKTEKLNESSCSEEDSLVCLQPKSNESSEDGEVNKHSKKSDVKNEVTIAISNDDLEQTSKFDPDSTSAIEAKIEEEIHSPLVISKKSPGKVKSKPKSLMQATVSIRRINIQENTKKTRTSSRNPNLNENTKDGEKIVRSNLRKTRFKRANNKQLSGKISKNIKNLALRHKTSTVVNQNTGKSVKVPFKKKVVSKRLSDSEIIEALNSVENVEICESVSSAQQNSILKGNKLRGKEVSSPKTSPIKRHGRSSQSYAVTKVKQIAANKGRKSIGKERHSPSKLLNCEVCNKNFSNLSESKLHEISHCRYPVLILHRCDSAQGVLSLIREVDFPSYESDLPVSLEKSEVIKSDEVKEQFPVEPTHSDSSLGKDSRKISVKENVCSDTSKEPMGGKQDDIVNILEEMFGSSNDDSTSLNQVKAVDCEAKGLTDNSALVEVLDESFKSEGTSGRPERKKENTVNKTSRKLKSEENVQLQESVKTEETRNTSDKHVQNVKNVSSTANSTDVGSICGSENDGTCSTAGDTVSLNVLKETDEYNKNDESGKVKDNQITLNSEIEIMKSKACLSDGSLGSTSDSIPHEHNLLQVQNSDEPVKGRADAHNGEKLPNEDRTPPCPISSEKGEVINKTALHDNKSHDDSESNADKCIVSDREKLELTSQGGQCMVPEEDCEVSEIKQLSKEAQKDDLDKKDTNLIESDKRTAEGGRDSNMKTEQENYDTQKTEEISDGTVKEIDKDGLNDMISSGSTMKDGHIPISVSREPNESSNENVFQIQPETLQIEKEAVDVNEEKNAENSETVNDGTELVSQELKNNKESTDEVITPSESSFPQMECVDTELQKVISCEMEQTEMLSNAKIITDCEKDKNKSEVTNTLSAVKEIKQNSNEKDENTDLMKLEERANTDINSEKGTHISSNNTDINIQLSEGTQKSAEMSEDSESCCFKFDAIEEPALLENSSRSSNGEILSDLITCGSGDRVTECVSTVNNIPATESVTECDSEVQDESKCDDIDILIKEVLESNSLESDKSNNDDVIPSLTDGGVSNNNNNGCVQNNRSGNVVSDETSLTCDKSSSIKSDTQKSENIPVGDELNLEPVSDDEMDFI